MKRPFLLLAGGMEAPESSTEEWIRCYETEQDAEDAVTKVSNNGREFYKVEGQNWREYDWYDIIDLRNWTD